MKIENQNDLVSILIPVYNREKIIGETIESALNQTYKNIEIIVVDNKSTDNTFKICKEYQKRYPDIITVFQNERNLGPVKNWKKCLEYARGKYVKILFSDDQIGKTFVEKSVKAFIKHPEIGFVFTRVLIYGSVKREYIFGNTGIYPMNEFVKAQLLNTKLIPVSPGCALFRRKDVEKNLLINIPNPKNVDFSKYGAGNDLLLFLLTALDYKYFYYIDEPLSYFRAHEDSLTISNNLKWYYDFAKYLYIHKSHHIF